MNVEIKEGAERRYPYLGIHKGLNRIVLFSGPGMGVQLNECGSHCAGYYTESWGEETYFEPFTGTITLSN